MTATLFTLLFPESPRRIPCERGINIALRSAHLMTSSLLLGGHAFDVAPHRLILFLYLTMASGAGLIAMELYRSCRWIYLLKGVLVELKLTVLIAAGVWWDHRVPLLLLVVLLGSVGSHLPARFRYFSVIHGRVLTEPAPARSGFSASTWRQ
ncbi:MAG TPA: hypothetical protein VLT62_18135 [Candidatus Methylomirabilis sp.]|nr:hypothetical protein [Candidatus Methylomirabilis sp.]